MRNVSWERERERANERGRERERDKERERESESESETQDMASFGRFGVEALGLGLRSGPASKSISS